MNAITKFESCIAYEPNTGCWLWLGYLNRDGYGVFNIGGDQVLAHRWAFVCYRGTIPDGMELHHVCTMRCCVNPAHLLPVTHKEHQLVYTSTTPIYLNSQKTQCIHGHKFDAANTYYKPPYGRRQCRACAVVATHRYRSHKKGMQP